MTPPISSGSETYRADRSRDPARINTPRQKPNHKHAVFDPLVSPANPPHRHPTCSEADPTRTHHSMVTLAKSSPGDRSASTLQSETATVMLQLYSAVWYRREDPD